MLTLMIIDDDPSMIHIIKSLLDDIPSLSLQYHAFTNGNRAKNKFTEIKPDLIITDINMPDIDGYELIRYFKERSDTPILAMTFCTWGSENTNLPLELAEQLGANYTLCKSKITDEISLLVSSIFAQ